MINSYLQFKHDINIILVRAKMHDG